MKISTLVMAVSLPASALGLSVHPSYAIDLSGAWASQTDACDKIFNKGKTISFKKNSGLFGSGFIVERNVLRGPTARCSITATKQDGVVTHMIAACSTDIIMSSVQFSFKTVNDNQIIRLFPGMEGMEIPYYRCSFSKM